MNEDSRADHPIDLTALDPARDTARFDTLARDIARDAMAARARRSAGVRPADVGIVTGLLAWSWPALVAAAIVLAIALPAAARVPRDDAASFGGIPAANAIGISRGLSDLLRPDRSPSLYELSQALSAEVAK